MNRTARIRIVTLFAAASSAVIPASTAQAGLLDGLLPGTGAIVQTVESTLPTGGGLVSGVTGEVGGVVTGVEATVGGSVDSAIASLLGGGGAGGGTLPADALDALLASLGFGSQTGGGEANGGEGSGTLPGTGSGADGPAAVVDAAPPLAKVKVLSTLRQIARSGELLIQVTSDEVGVVAVGGAVRPGMARKSATRTNAVAKKHSRTLIKFPAAVLAFRKAGALTMSVKLGRAAVKTLAASKNARIALGIVSADLARNQGSGYVKRNILR